MSIKGRSPFAGKPATRQTTDRNGNIAFAVEPRFLTPQRAVLAGFLSKLAGLGLLGVNASAVLDTNDVTPETLVVALVLTGIEYVVLSKLIHWLFRKRMRLMLTVGQFSVRRIFGWKHYDRELPHRFALLPHDATQAERDDEEYRAQEAQLQRKVVRKQRLYANSFHVVFEYLGQRNDVMTVFGQKEAVAIAARLQACDNVLDAFARQGHGTPLAPAQEWPTQPGAIPENV